MNTEPRFSRASTTYFNVGGPHNTDITLDLAVDWVQTNDTEIIIVASTSGLTACRLAERLPEQFHERIVIARQRWNDGLPQEPKGLSELEKIARTYWIPPQYLSSTTHPLVPETLRELSHGIKVGFECAHFMITNSFLLPLQNILCLAGTKHGADSIIEMFINEDLTLKLRHILCLPMK